MTPHRFKGKEDQEELIGVVQSSPIFKKILTEKTQ
jgi:hypothetical protein